MSTFDKLFAKGKQKAKELQKQYEQRQSGQQQGQPPQNYPGQQSYPPQNQAPYPGNQHPPQQYAPPNQYQQPPQQQSGGITPHQYSHNQWHPAGQQQQQQWGAPPQQNNAFAPPIPQSSKPQSRPVPQNRPMSSQPPPPQNLAPSQGEKVYWKPSFAASTPVSQNFRHETGDHGWGNNEKQMYTDQATNSFHHDNRLIVRALVQNGSYTSARLTSFQTLSRPRGYLTATILPPVAEGIWPAYWMLPADPFVWPKDGEVDIFESWNGDCMNHSCLHWGHFNGEDHDKHRVAETHLPNMAREPHTFGFAWIEEDGIPDWRGRMVWYIDGQPVMKANIPVGTRRMEDYRLLINIAMGGNVCQGKLPKDGYYDMIVSEVKMCEEPEGGWQQFEHAWSNAREGKAN
ncbi:glycoside hydrolase family 16 protein [Dothidotthia symphoricarpi CBS 119687]|uniref:Glycoside hydrolase family 16 protein n=1 Tax=Dothidotthia symphoricarpi CBS 119687 TaxID=1392245 RepID=A0A6A6ASC2_9PLEO|nr:glycoside hydrolase family 16 protein [Dothidotthia symphoricarpi CBS 119687]KAF2133885.1 glycoside hydrolase family 16 protein [Dothidotthia symphoricarpi CBS 119687]